MSAPGRNTQLRGAVSARRRTSPLVQSAGAGQPDPAIAATRAPAEPSRRPAPHPPWSRRGTTSFPRSCAPPDSRSSAPVADRAHRAPDRSHLSRPPAAWRISPSSARRAAVQWGRMSRRTRELPRGGAQSGPIALAYRQVQDVITAPEDSRHPDAVSNTSPADILPLRGKHVTQSCHLSDSLPRVVHVEAFPHDGRRATARLPRREVGRPHLHRVPVPIHPRRRGSLSSRQADAQVSPSLRSHAPSETGLIH
jgi:hypothetical protein